MSERLSPKTEKGISIEQCVLKAQKYIDEQGVCLFLYDVKGSKEYSTPDRQNLQKKLLKINDELVDNFGQYFPENKLRTNIHTDLAPFLIGDGSLVGINNAQVIPKITQYLKDNCPEATFHYNVAKDGWDEEGMRTIK